MRIGVVIGSVWATRKEPKLEGLKLLIVEPLDYKMAGNITREPYIAADVVDAGIGDKVLIVETRKLSKDKNWRVAEIIEKAK